jgi:DNA repair exonuclease SbcCD ATPase subunit
MEFKKKGEELQNQNKKLHSQNNDLSNRFSYITDELKSSHVLIDNLYSELDSHQSRQKDVDRLRAKWKEAKEVYQTKIDDLKSQLTDAGKVVTIEVYNWAVDSAAQFSKALKEKEEEIDHLSDKVCNLERLIEEKDAAVHELKTLSAPTGQNRVSIYTDNVTSIGCENPIATIVDRNSIKNKLSTSTEKSRNSSRGSLLKSGGGRAALQQQLKKSRKTQLRPLNTKLTKGHSSGRSPFKVMNSNISASPSVWGRARYCE